MTTLTWNIIYGPYTTWGVNKLTQVLRLLTSWLKGSNNKSLSSTVRTWHFELKLLISWPDITLMEATELSIIGHCFCGFQASRKWFSFTQRKKRHHEWNGNKSSYDVFELIRDQNYNSRMRGENRRTRKKCHKRFRYQAINVRSQLFNGRKLPTEKPRTRQKKMLVQMIVDIFHMSY